MAEILVVDDDQAILDLIGNVLKKSGYGIKKVNRSEDVVKLDLKFYDLIILDIMMPGMDGFELMEIIRDQGRGFSKEMLKRAKNHGLGLYISDRIITKLGGKIELGNNPDQGAWVKVCLDLVE